MTMLNFDVDGVHLLQLTNQLIADTNTVWDKAAQIPTGTATFENAIRPILNDENNRRAQYSYIWFFKSVSPSEELRDAATKCEDLFAADHLSRSQREDIYVVIDAVWLQKDTLTHSERLYLQKLRQDFHRVGLGTVHNAADKALLSDLLGKITKMQSQYIQNLDSDLGGQWFTSEELQGVSESRIAQWKTDDQGRHFANHKMPNLLAILNDGVKSETRRRMWYSFENRASETNATLLRDLVLLRDEAARLQGYKHFAHQKEIDRILTTDQVISLLNTMGAALKELVVKEVQDLTVLKSKDPQATEKEFLPWDKLYYKSRLAELSTGVDAEVAAEYFPLPQCLERMFALLGILFGVEYEKVEDASTWHPDAEGYRVWNRDGDDRLLGYFYLDLYPRDHKYGHRGNYGLSSGYTNVDGSKHHPCAVLVSNWRPPSDTAPSLLKFPDVISLFHELGHGLHHVTCTSSIARLSSGGTPRDFVEIPSIMLEHIFWTKPVLRFISGHYKLKEKLPEDVIGKLIDGRFDAFALGQAHSLHLSSFDMKIHAPESHEALEKMDMSQVYNTMRLETSCINGPTDVQSFCRWRFPQGYASEYYTYLLSDALSYDIFECKFRPLMPSTEVKVEVAHDLVSDALRDEFRKYRRIVLEPGAGTDSYLDLLKSFMGREPSAEAYLAMLRSETAKKA